MSRLVYVVGSEYIGGTGVEKKVHDEMLAFNLNGIETELIVVEEKKKWKKIIPFSASFKWDKIEIKNVDYIYIRWEPVSYPFICFLKRCKTYNPNAIIIMEIGTYPYEDELKHFSNFVTITRDIFYQRFLQKYINRITTFSDFESLFNIPIIKMVNCISVDRISSPKRQTYRKDNVLNIIAVASIAYYYGYDRLLKGIANYYENGSKKIDVQFHLIGTGTILPELKEMCRKLNIDKYVTFYGYKTGIDLDELYEIADVGIDVLGGHRKDDFYFGTLKSREYMSRGIPFVTEYPLPDNISPIYKYILKVPADESNIDISRIVDFFYEIKKESRETTIKNMREFAYSYCDVSVAMNPVIDYLKESSV